MLIDFFEEMAKAIIDGSTIVKNSVVDAAKSISESIGQLTSSPDYSNVRAPHIPIDGFDKKEDYLGAIDETAFAVNLAKRIEHDLRVILGYDEDYRISFFNLMQEAYNKNVFESEEHFQSLDNFRKTRNIIVHGKGTKISHQFR